VIIPEQMQQPLALLDHLEDIDQRILSAEHKALLLDFDGTIAPIVLDPAQAKVIPKFANF
jgi:trehalose-6-phosphatase